MAVFVTDIRLLPLIAISGLMIAAGHISGARAEITTIANCNPSPFAGKWVNENASDKFLVRLDITDKCEKVISKPVSMNSPWAGMLGRERHYVYRQYILRPYSRCSPANCVWGRARGKPEGRKLLRASFRMFWSQRTLELTPDNGKLKVRWRVHYIGRNRPDRHGESVLVPMQ